MGANRAWVKAFTGLAYLGVLAVTLTAGALLGWMGRSQVMTEALRLQATGEPPAKVFALDLGPGREYLDLLVLGCDEDLVYGGIGVLRHKSRSDMMMYVRLDFAHNRIDAISIPRDTLVRLPGYREHKVNAYHAIGWNEGGAERAKALARDAAEHILGLRADRVVVLDFASFERMVDLLGGVEVYVDKDMKYTDRAGGLFIDLKEGRQTLDGAQAMGFVRYRQGDSDFSRQRRQKEFIMALRERALDRWQVSPEVVDESMNLLGGAFTAREIASLMLFGHKVGADNVRMETVPVTQASRGTLRLDRPALERKLREMRLLDHTPETFAGG